MLKTSDYYYDLPKELIAQDPLEDRSSSRLLHMDRETGELSHEVFSDIGKYLKAGAVLVINNTKVIPARLYGVREGSGGHVEILLLRRLSDVEWECLVKPGKKCRTGARIVFGEGVLTGEITEVLDNGNRHIRFEFDGIFEEVLDQLGEMPLPPYIHNKLEDKTRYNTVYAKHDGSAAAPTAGLHFTEKLMEELQEKGVIIAPVTLHVGLGTFRPVKAENLEEHEMHSEFYVVTEETADIINKAKEEGRRVICVGTTSCRTIESAATEKGHIEAGSNWTQIFIYPGYDFKLMDALITNFHLPESTLVMLVSAFAGREHVLHAYEEAVKEGYRFFSFGDAMMLS
ncbi:MAG: tRNA preQ1(34) S-adenosylmethionine ribosyltransferase-isomerase QueA [Lachnospiraceae bacterium]|nr:tRNA preQ1(34) S-adenosylmethionine ribosyltransferase-isomerase QueA [Candidatus Equihabitans merdae]